MKVEGFQQSQSSSNYMMKKIQNDITKYKALLQKKAEDIEKLEIIAEKQKALMNQLYKNEETLEKKIQYLDQSQNQVNLYFENVKMQETKNVSEIWYHFLFGI